MIVVLSNRGNCEVGYGRLAIGAHNPAANEHRSGARSPWEFLSDAEHTYCRRITPLPPRRGQYGYAKYHGQAFGKQ
jgi:hypothetical protein